MNISYLFHLIYFQYTIKYILKGSYHMDLKKIIFPLYKKYDINILENIGVCILSIAYVRYL